MEAYEYIAAGVVGTLLYLMIVVLDVRFG